MDNKHFRTLFSKLLIFIIIMAILAGVQLRSTYVPVSVKGPTTTCTSADKQQTIASTVKKYISTAATRVSRGDSRGMNTSTTTSNPQKCTNYSSQGYLLAVEFGQQSTGAFLAYSELSKFASLFNLSIVEPYMDGTNIRGVPRSGKDSQKGVPLGTLYNVESLQNTTVAEKGHLLLLPFGDSAMERCNGSSQWKCV